MEAKSIEFPIYEVLEKKNLVRIELENNEKRIYINRESGILDMRDIDEIDARVLEGFEI